MYQDYLLLGKVERNFTTVQMSAPKIEPLTARRIHPIYTQTGSLNANLIAKAVDYALAHMAPLPDTLSPALREKIRSGRPGHSRAQHSLSVQCKSAGSGPKTG